MVKGCTSNSQMVDTLFQQNDPNITFVFIQGPKGTQKMAILKQLAIFLNYQITQPQNFRTSATLATQGRHSDKIVANGTTL